MEYAVILFFCLGISLDVFGATVCQGSMLASLERGRIAVLCLIYSVVQVAAMEIGRLLGTLPRFASYYTVSQGLWTFLAALIFFALGVYLVVKAIRRKDIFEYRSEIRFKKVLGAAVLTSIDSLFSGIGARFLDTSWVSCLLTLFGVTALCAFGGISIGYHFGYTQKNTAYWIGGVLFIITGAAVLICSTI